MVLTDWMAGKLISKSWCEQILQANVPNCVANLREPMRNVAWDPTNDFHYPWQSGMTGIGYNLKTLTDNKIPEPKKIADLWSIPADKMSFLSEARDTFGLGLLKLGLKADPGHGHRGGPPGGPRRHPAAGRRWPPLPGQRVPPGLRPEEGLGGVRLVGRPRVVGNQGRPLRLPRGRHHALD